MRFRDYIGSRLSFIAASAALVLIAATLDCAAQRTALLTPSSTELSRDFAAAVRESLARSVTVDDLDLSHDAAKMFSAAAPFNMTTAEGRELGQLLGTAFFVLIDANLQRRTSLEIEEYYEASAAMFLVSSATGGLVRFDIHSHKLPTAAGSRKDLLRAAPYAAASLATAIAAERTASGITVSRPRFPDVPEPGTKGFEGLRPPMPFRRIKPEYTATANLYGIKATVEIAVDIDAAGAIANTEIVRWGGYGLDESVEKTVRAMNWRPATLGERSLPMRVLLRYNFVKVDKDDEN